MKNKNERGAFTIEAILSLSIFMFAFLTILSLALVVRAESTMQYAINQVAKEISQYYYIADRVGLVSTDDGGNQELDEAIGAIFDFSDAATSTVKEYTSGISTDNLVGTLENYKNLDDDVTEIADAANQVYESFGPIMEDPKGVVTSLASMLASDISREVVSKVMAQPMCKALVPKYIPTGKNQDANAALEKMGIDRGLDGLDFRLSSFLSDDKSINVVVVYQIEVNGFGIFDDTLVIKQTASTAAWLAGDIKKK